MSTTLPKSKLIDLCTPSIGYDAQVQAACDAFDRQMYEIIDDTGQVIFIPNIMGLTDPNLVDILAWQFHVDFYDASKPLEFRKTLVQQAISWHRRKGTVALVQEVLDTYWPGGATLVEWFNYYSPLPPGLTPPNPPYSTLESPPIVPAPPGNPPTVPMTWHDRYRFRVYIDERIIDPGDEQAVLDLIEHYKPVSRWCEGIFRPIASDCMIGWCGMLLRFIYRESEAPDYVFPAHGYQMSGPSLGTPGTATQPFTVQLRVGAAVSDVVTITPNDNGAGGAFMPASVTLDNTQRSATFTYTPASEGTHLISVTNDAGLDDPDPIAIVARVPTYTLSGPSGGAVGVASTPFTVASTDVQSGAVTVTPHDGGKGGTFTPSTVQLTAMAPSATFTYTPAASGSISISATNDGGLTDPLGLPYAASIGDGSIIAAWPDSGVNHNNASKVGSPIIKLNVLNGKPVVRLSSASGDGFNLASPIVNDFNVTSRCAFAVMKPALTGKSVYTLMTATNHGPASIDGPSATFYAGWYWWLATVAGMNMSASAFHIYTSNFVNNGVFQGYQDGTLFSNGAGAGETDPYITIGYLGTSFSDGDIAEIILYDGTLAIRAKLLLVLTVLIQTGQIPSSDEANAMLAAGDLVALEAYLILHGVPVEQAKDTLEPMTVGDRANIEAYLSAKYGIPVTSGGSAVDPIDYRWNDRMVESGRNHMKEQKL